MLLLVMSPLECCMQETCCCTTCIEKGCAAFELLQDIIKEAYAGSSLMEQRRNVAKNLEVYFERHYRSLLLQSSKDVNRCMTHALSHPKEEAFQCVCSHDHVVECEIMQQDTAFLQEVRADIEHGLPELEADVRQHLKWQLDSFEGLLSKYKAHLLRKTWDREAYKRMLGRLTVSSAVVIIDYGQKVEPMRQREAQSECFGKAGISQFGATFLMLASGFSATDLDGMIAEDRRANVQDGDLIAFTTVFYNSDAYQVGLLQMYGERESCLLVNVCKVPMTHWLLGRTGCIPSSVCEVA